MQQMRLAVATDDGERFVGRHFGDAEFFDIYDISSSRCRHVGRLANSVDEDDGHANPKKARGIAGLLGQEHVHVVATRVFGPNLQRIKKKFVCVMVGHETIADSLDMLVSRYPELVATWQQGEERAHLDWRHD